MAIIDEGTQAWEAAGVPPLGYPAKDDPRVQAVAAELLGDPMDPTPDYWHKQVVTNKATALHAAVRVVHVLDRHNRAPWTLMPDGEHRHYYDGQSLVHGHPGGEEPHGYYEHPEDGARPADREPEATAAYAVQSDPADELVWSTRRLLDAQWDVAQALARVQQQR